MSALKGSRFTFYCKPELSADRGTAIISGLNPYDKLIRLEPPSSAPGAAGDDAVVHAEAVDGVARVDVHGEGAGGQGPGADAAGEAAGVERAAVGRGLQVDIVAESYFWQMVSIHLHHGLQ